MQITRFSKEQAQPAHNGTILAMPVLPPGLKAPFNHAWGYVETGGSIEGHAHPADEIYFIYRGTGIITVGSEEQAVSEGDLIAIPSNAFHALRNTGAGHLQWFALWWPPLV
ncbi:MAG: cupin domain-containing protein [Anaerolineae bacterium]